MEATEATDMAEDRRALLTDREREILLNNGEDVSEKYYGVVVSRVRKKIELLDDDLEALAQHETLADELRDVVCEGVHTAAGPRVTCPECDYEDREAMVRAHAQEKHDLSNEELNQHFGHEHPLSSDHY